MSFEAENATANDNEHAGVPEVAVIGMSGRFPGAPDLHAFWRNLRDGVESIRFYTDDDLLAAGVDPALLADPAYVKARGALPRDVVENFDAAFFGYSPREAETLEPAHRLFLECCWEALENAGHDPGRVSGAVGVYAGAGAPHYIDGHVRAHPELAESVGEFQLAVGSGKDFVATRASYKLNLRGPSVSVQTGCSTSLVAIHTAAQALLHGECEMALAGGTHVIPRDTGYLYSPGGIDSPDGHCRAFDARSAGTVVGSGVGVVLLKRLADAVRDGDPIRAVIKGSAVNNDGSLKVAFTAPSVEGQAAVIREALEVADVDPATIRFVEGHGSGTELGDPIEIAALTQAYRGWTDRKRYAAVGSVKTNLGHLDTAAGVAGFIKAVLAVENGQVPPTLHFENPNPRIPFADSPFYVSGALEPWGMAGTPRRAGVSSFGIGGTNAHVVIEQAPEAAPSDARRDAQVLTLSARTPAALEAATDRLSAHLRENPGRELADVAWTLQIGRREFPFRRALVVEPGEDAAGLLAGRHPERVATAEVPEGHRSVAFLFPGVGDQYPQMARGLYDGEPVFRAQVDRCAEILRPHLGMDIRETLFPGEAPVPATGGIDLKAMLGRAPDADPATERLNRTELAQPAVFVIEYALARTLMAWGIVPEAVIGHSLGEYAAACIAGILSLEDALALVARRAALIGTLPGGAMLAVPLSPHETEPFLADDACIATVNAPRMCVVAGTGSAVDAVQARLAKAGHVARRLATSHAFHSPMMESAVQPMAELVGTFRLRAPRIPLVSNVTGTWITAAEATDPGYWARHAREPVRFDRGIEEVLRGAGRVLVEVGPGQTLSTFVRQRGDSIVPVVPTLRYPYDRTGDVRFLLSALSRLWLAGATSDWAAFHQGERLRRVPLPTYPWERERYFIDAPKAGRDAGEKPRGGRTAGPASWLYVPSWRRAAAPRPATAQTTVLVFADDDALSVGVLAGLRAHGRTPLVVSPGDAFRQEADGFAVRPGSREDLNKLAGALAERELSIGRFVYLWSTDEESERGVIGALAAIDTLGRQAESLDAVIVTRGAVEVEGADEVRPARAALPGAMAVVPGEYPSVAARVVDVDVAAGDAGADRMGRRIAAEALAGDERVVALRARHRWVRGFDAMPAAPADAAPIRQGGVYLFIGGLYGRSALLASHLARTHGARIGVIDPVLPHRGGWDAMVRARLPEDPLREQIELVRALESEGATIVTVQAHPAEARQVSAAVAEVAASLGTVHGVVLAPFAYQAMEPRALSEMRTARWNRQLGAMLDELNGVAVALEGRELDFVLVESSLSTVLGGVGVGEAAALLAVAEAFCVRQSSAATPWTSVAWDRAATPADPRGYGLSAADTLAAFQHLVAASGEPHLVISTGDVAHRLRQRAQAPHPGGAGGSYARPRLAVEYHAPGNEVEEAIAAMWEELLGISPIGIHDDFFALGGHSLLATQIISRCRDLLGLELPLKAIFEAPTIARFAALVEEALVAEIDELSDEEALQKRLSGQARPAAPRAAITRRGGGPVHPMSWAQERLWYLDQVEPGRAFYNIPIAALVSARLDVDVLERALSEIIRRHEGLRTVFRLVEGEPKQIVQPPYRLKVEIRDLRGPDGQAAPEDVVRHEVSEEGARPFDLAAGPLVRASLLRVSGADHALVITVHHIVTDGWSMPIVTREMDDLYGAFAAGQPSPLPELAVQYADYSAWQREYLTGPTLQKQLDYWRAHLDGAPTLELPTDRPRPAVQTHRGAIHRFVWNPELTGKLRALGIATGSSMNMVVMAGYYLMLHQYSGQDDVVVGTLLGNRSRAETEPIVGFFVNSAPIRARLRPEMSFAGLVKQVRTSVLDADTHQDLPFDKIVEELKTERDPSRNPLFQVMYFHHTFVNNLHHKEHSEVGSDLNMRSLFQETGVSLVDTHATKFDMTFATLEMDGRLACMVEYSSDLWSPESMARMMDHVRVLLDAAAADPQAPLSSFSMVAGAEREVLLAGGANDRPVPRGTSAVSRFEARVEACPEAVAVEFEDGRLTYGELNARANRIARRLAALGVRPGDRVGLAAGQSAQMVAALAGILKAGAAVVPLDPEYPAERLAFMVRDTGARAVVTRGGALAGIAPVPIPVLELDVDAESIETEDARNLAGEVGAGSIAYVIYTSGSTGQPKGVLVSHRAIVRTVVDAEYAPVSPGDRVAQTANLSFDAAIWEVWAALLNGAATVGIGREALLATAEYASALRSGGITHTFVTTQLFNRHVRLQADLFAPLSYVLFGGEKVDASAVRACLESGRPKHLLHVYGPTETTVFATAYEVHSVDGEAHTLPIGRPIGGTCCYVLDPRGMLCGTGVPGELFIGGDGVAAGYLDRQGPTAERFVPDPFRGGRMYRTGDRVRWTGEGQIEFLGRVDDQVKVRGFRVEPGEVQAALRAHPAVRDAVVVARDDGPGDRRLVGYVAGTDPAALQDADFRAFLRERLPDYMVPSAFVVLDALPLTPNGKVDVRRLPAPDPTRANAGEAASTADAPRNRTEEILCGLWREVLQVDRVGIHDNFFSLGGDSILSIQVIARAAQQGVRLTPRQVFVHQTVAELAAVATPVEEHRAEQDAVTGPVVLAPVQRWFLQREIPDPHHFNIGLAFDLRDVQRAELERAVAAVVAHHDALRLRFHRGADGWAAENAGVGGPVPLDFVDLSGVPAGDVDAEEQARATALQASLDLAGGPLIRFALMDRGAGRLARLGVAAHHLVVDAVSLQVLMDDLETAYRQLLRGQPVALPAKTTSFRHWADRLAEYAGSDEVEREAAFWLGQQATPPLPRDRNGPNAEGATERITVSLDAETTRALLQEVPPVYGTHINDALLAALAMACREWTGESAVRIDLEGHGREDLFEGVDLSRTVGWFTAIHPLRLQVPEDGHAGHALTAVKERLREVPRRGIGHGLLRWMRDDDHARSLAAIPDPEISFNYLGQVQGGAGDERLFTPADAHPGEARSPRAPRSHLLAVDALVAEGQLHATWAFSPGVHTADTVRRLADGYLDALRAIVDHCRDPEAGGFTPSDFELAGLDQEGLDALLSRIGG